MWGEQRVSAAGSASSPASPSTPARQPGDLYAALPGSSHARCGLQRPGGGRRGGRDPHRSRRPRPGGADRRPRLRGVQPARAPRRRLLLDLRRPVAPDDDDRRDRHQRQDHDQLPVRGGAARRRAHDGPGRRGGDQDRPGARQGVADHAGGAGPAGAARRHGRARGDGGRDGGLQPLPGPRPGRGHPLRRRRVHQPLPGPPGLSRRVRGLFPGQGEAVHPGVLGCRRGERGRPVRPPPRGRGDGAGHHVLRGRGLGRLPAGGVARRRRALRRRRVDLPGHRPRRRGGRRVRHAARRRSTSPTPSARSWRSSRPAPTWPTRSRGVGRLPRRPRRACSAGRTRRRACAGRVRRLLAQARARSRRSSARFAR